MPACAGGISTRMILRSMLISDAPLDRRSVSMVGTERPTRLEVSLELAGARGTAASSASADKAAREDALRRSREHSPFLRDGAAAWPELVEKFLESGSVAAVKQALTTTGGTVEAA